MNKELSYKNIKEIFEGLDYKKIKLPKLVEAAKNVLPKDMDDKMKILFAVSECSFLASQFGIPIQLNSKTKVTTNLYTIMMATSGCVDKNTEFCTPNGWKTIDKFEDGDKVLSWNEDGTSQFDYPIAYIKNRQDTLYHYKSKTVDMMLSENHNMALLTSTGKPIKMKERDFRAEVLKNTKGSSKKLPFNFTAPEGEGLNISDDQLRLFIAYVADGTENGQSQKVRIRVKKEYKKERLRKLLKSIYGEVNEIVTDSEPEYSRFYFKPIFKDKLKNLDPLLKLNHHQMEVAAHEFYRWDGAIDERNPKRDASFVFRTTKKREADIVQYIWNSVFDEKITINKQERHDKTPFHIEYMVVKTKAKTVGFASNNLITEVKSEDGFEYCFTMPNERWVARRDDKIFLTMNSGKDRASGSIRSCFEEVNKKLEQHMKLQAVDQAKAICAIETGSDKNWKKFLDMNTRSLFPSVSTGDGLMAQFSTLQKTTYGSPTVTSSEFLTEITSDNMKDNLKTLALLYDVGNANAKTVKTDELQISQIKGLNVNMLMFSSPHNLKDKNTKKVFMDYMSSMFSRRTLYYFNNTPEQYSEVNNVLEFLDDKLQEDDTIDKNLKKLEAMSIKIWKTIKAKGIKTLTLETRDASSKLDNIENMTARDLYNLYEIYCSNRAIDIPAKYHIAQLATKHLHWKTLKIAGLFSIMRGKSVIDKETFLMAVSVVELYVLDLIKLQKEIDLEPYELLANYCQERSSGNKPIIVSKHTLVKQGLIASNASNKRLEELVALCNDIETVNGTFSLKTKGIQFIPIAKVVKESPKFEEKTNDIVKDIENNQIKDITQVVNEKESQDADVITVSFKPWMMVVNKDGKKQRVWRKWENRKKEKEYRNSNAGKGFIEPKPENSNFEIYRTLTSKSYSYSPYTFKDGVRNLESLNSTANTLVIDVDKTTLDINTMAELLEEYSYVLATTSDPTNMFKYRVILHLDRHIDLNPVQWKLFYKSVSDLLGIDYDPQINKASMFHGYEGSKVLYNKGIKLETKPHIIKAHAPVKQKEIKVAKSSAQLAEQWDYRFDEFAYAYDMLYGRTLKLYSVMRTACAMGWEESMVEELLEEIAQLIARPYSYSRLKKYILSQIPNFIKK